ncbi:MAG: hypothetical protein M3457_20980, partial [Chloroflexota bacterium]|nr:hypothetical protein [Chloroflexota bacterium]
MRFESRRHDCSPLTAHRSPRSIAEASHRLEVVGRLVGAAAPDPRALLGNPPPALTINILALNPLVAYELLTKGKRRTHRRGARRSPLAARQTINSSLDVLMAVRNGVEVVIVDYHVR